METKKIEEQDIKKIFQSANGFLIGADDIVKPETDEECAYALDLAEKSFISWFKSHFKVETIEKYDEDEVNSALVKEVSEKLTKIISEVEETLKKHKEAEEKRAEEEKELKEKNLHSKTLEKSLKKLVELFCNK